MSVMRPMIILSASGMAETGRILHHLKNNIEDPRNTIVIVSWQAPDTLGRRLADGNAGEDLWRAVWRRAEVVTIGGLSAHAGQDLLVEYARSAVKQRLKKVFLVHGEQRSQLQRFTEKLAEEQSTQMYTIRR